MYNRGLTNESSGQRAPLPAPLIALFSLWTETHPAISLLEEVQQ